MPNDIRKSFTVRILRKGSTDPIGVGMVAGERNILTCAHVVNTALGRPQRAQEKPPPDLYLQVEFPLLGNTEVAPLRNCRVEAWIPPSPSRLMGGDVAGLVLVGEGLPEGAGLAQLVSVPGGSNVTASVFGYPGIPPRRENGAWVSLLLRGAVGGGAIQFDIDRSSAIRAQPGYSGSPTVVTMESGDAVIGMLAVTSVDENAWDVYAIPSSRLVEAWPGVLGQLTLPSSLGMGPFSSTAMEVKNTGRTAKNLRAEAETVVTRETIPTQLEQRFVTGYQIQRLAKLQQDIDYDVRILIAVRRALDQILELKSSLARGVAAEKDIGRLQILTEELLSELNTLDSLRSTLDSQRWEAGIYEGLIKLDKRSTALSRLPKARRLEAARQLESDFDDLVGRLETNLDALRRDIRMIAGQFADEAKDHVARLDEIISEVGREGRTGQRRDTNEFTSGRTPLVAQTWRSSNSSRESHSGTFWGAT